MLLRKVLCHALQSVVESAGLRGTDLPADERQHFARTGKLPGEILGSDCFPEEIHNRAVRLTSEGLRHVEPIPIHRSQFDHAESVEPHEISRGFGRGLTVGLDDLFKGPLAQTADGHQQQAPVRHDGPLLGERQLMLLRSLLDDVL